MATRPRILRFLTSSRRFEITQVIPLAKKCKLFRLRNDGVVSCYVIFKYLARHPEGFLEAEGSQDRKPLRIDNASPHPEISHPPYGGFEMTDVPTTTANQSTSFRRPLQWPRNLGKGSRSNTQKQRDLYPVPSSRRARQGSRDLGTSSRSALATRPRILRFLTSSRRFEITQVIPLAKKCKLFRLRNDGVVSCYVIFKYLARHPEGFLEAEGSQDRKPLRIDNASPHPEISHPLTGGSK